MAERFRETIRIRIPAREGVAVDLGKGYRVSVIDLAGHQGADCVAITQGGAVSCTRTTRAKNRRLFPKVGQSIYADDDDAMLTLRPHHARRKPYTRVVVCETDPIPETARVLAPPADLPEGTYPPTIVLAPAGRQAVFTSLATCADLVFVGDSSSQMLDLDAAMRALRARGIVTVLCEGGPTLGGRLLEAGLVRELAWFVSPTLLQTPHAVPPLAGADVTRYARGWRFADVERVGDDLLLRAYLHV